MTIRVTLPALLLLFSSVSYAQSGWFLQHGGDQDLLLFDVELLDASTVIAVGENGTILRTTDAGASWHTVPSGTDQVLHHVQSHGPDLAVILGNSGTALKSTDGGTSWSPLSTGTTKSLFGMYYFDQEHWVVVGQAGLSMETRNGGATFSSPTSAANNYNWIDFHGNFGVIVGNVGTLRVTTNRGSSWTSRSSGTQSQLLCVSIANDSTAVAVGIRGTIIKTTNKGRDWRLVEASFPISTIQVSGVVRLSETDLIAAAHTGLILVSSDGGDSWYSQYSDTHSNLEGIAFFDNMIGVAVGHKATIIRTNTAGVLDISRHGEAVAGGLRILEQYPLPLRSAVNERGTLRINVEQRGHVHIELLDVLGRSRGTLYDDMLDAGTHTVNINASGLETGLYFLHVKQQSRTLFGRLLVE